MVTASVTVPIFANHGGHLDAHPVLEGSSGYTQLTLSGEANSLILLSALDQEAKSVTLKDNPFEDVLHKTIVSHSKGFGSNLIVMSDTKNGRDLLKDEDELMCHQKGLFQCGQFCYHFLDICDHQCQCADCQDEYGCGGGNQKRTTFSSFICWSLIFDILFFLCQIGDMSLQPESSPTLKSQRSNGFWKVISMPSNGSLNLRIPFEVNGRLYLIANTLGTSGIASLGTYLRI